MKTGFPETGAFGEASDAQSSTLAGEVFARLKADIISSRLPPGTKLRLHDLRQAYGAGFSPLREALSRLSENRLVTAVGHRGFRVPEASAQDIMDVAMVRRQMEGFALRLAIRYGDDLWETRAIDAGEKFAMLQRSGKDFPEEVWESRHREFHNALIAACQSPCLLHQLGALCDQFDRYRRLSAKSRLPNAPRWLSHKEILQATLARDADKAVKLLEDHITEAARLIAVGLLARADAADKPVGKRKAAATARRRSGH